MPDQAFAIVARLPGWRLAEIVAQLCCRAAEIATCLASPAPDRAQVGLAEFLLAPREPTAAAVGTTHADLRQGVRTAVGELASILRDADADRLVTTRLGGMRLDEFAAASCVEGVVYGLDLVAGMPDAGCAPDREATKISTKALLAALITRAPGKSVEVRVPPIAAVQCVDGPRHTRGTPPNVVETDPITWIELAAGRVAWREATDDGRLRASGERSDLRGLLPLL